jgi:hypothetical protein
MKVKHIISLHVVITGLLIAFWLVGCNGKGSGSQAAWEAGRLWWKDPSDLVCRHRVAIIAKSMMERGDTFDLVFGSPRSGQGSKHVWIEETLPNGGILIIEPTQSDSAPERYDEIKRLHYAPDYKGNMAVISQVNRWLKEKGMELFDPKAEEGQKGKGGQYESQAELV